MFRIIVYGYLTGCSARHTVPVHRGVHVGLIYLLIFKIGFSIAIITAISALFPIRNKETICIYIYVSFCFSILKLIDFLIFNKIKTNASEDIVKFYIKVLCEIFICLLKNFR